MQVVPKVVVGAGAGADPKYWLGTLMGEYEPREGAFILQSTVSWAAALRFAIEARHGATPAEQFDSCRRHFRQHQVKRGPMEKQGEIYCLLFHSLTSATTLITLDCSDAGRPWMYPTAVVTWYYAHYHAIRAAAFARGLEPDDKHAALAKTINTGLRVQLPHPYNMRALHQGDGTYRVELPEAPGATTVRLVRRFDETLATAHGMILDYLSSTAKWEREDVERIIIEDKKLAYRDFRTQEARALRNQRLQREINFMHCAFRYRGNANYRDPLNLTYGVRETQDFRSFLHNLAVSARFAFTCGLAFAERAYGAEQTAHFVSDLNRNFRGKARATDAELFWQSFLTEASAGSSGPVGREA